MSVTRAQLIAKTYYLMNEPEDSSTYDRDVYVIPKIDAVIKQVCKWLYKDVRNEVIYKWWDVLFLRKKVPYTQITPTATTSAIALTDVTISADTTNYPATGKLFIEWDVITYTWVTGTAFTWVTWIQTTHLAWIRCELMFALPTDYWKDFMVKYYTDTQENELVNQDFRYITATDYYCIVWDSTSRALRISAWPWTYWFWYYQIVPSMTLDSSTCIIPDDEYALEMIPSICAWELLYQTEESTQAIQQLSIWYSKLQMFYSEYAELSKKPRKKVTYRRATLVV